MLWTIDGTIQVRVLVRAAFVKAAILFGELRL